MHFEIYNLPIAAFILCSTEGEFVQTKSIRSRDKKDKRPKKLVE